MSEFVLKDSLEEDDIFCCLNDDCGKEIEEETNYDWKYIQGETKEFICKHCGAKYSVEIERPILKQIFMEEDDI